MVTTSTLQLLAWLEESERSYAETVDVWRTSCPRLTVWEDAVADKLVAVRNGSVVVTPQGLELIQ
jgi:hypothetical protein